MKIIKTDMLPYEMFQALISEVGEGIYHFDSEKAVFPIEALDKLNNSILIKELRQDGVEFDYFVAEI